MIGTGGRGERGNRLGAPLLLLIAASLEAIKGQKAETTKREERTRVGGATCPRLGRAEMVEQKGRVLPRWRHEQQRECDTE